MGKILAIGGGDFLNRKIKRFDDFIAGFAIDKTIVYFPTPSYDNDKQIKSFSDIYQKEYGISTYVVRLTKDHLNPEDLVQIKQAKVIYVGGGDTHYFIKRLKFHNVLQYINEAYNNDCLLCGISAGGICWFKGCYTDKDAYSYNFSNYNYKMIDGLGFINFDCCPHFDTEGKESFLDDTKKGFAIENNACIYIENNNYQVISIKNECCYYIGDNKIVPLKAGKLNDL